MSDDLLCDQIAEKLEHGAVFQDWNSKHIISWMLNQNWTYPGIYGLDVDKDDTVLIYRLFNGGDPEGRPDPLCPRNYLVCDLLRIADNYDLTDTERAYLLSKVPQRIPRERKPRKTKPDIPELTLLVDKLRVTNRNGKYSYHNKEEEADLISFCRHNFLVLHKSIKGEWIQIVP